MKIAETIMRVLLSIIVVIGFTFLVILGALRLLADLLAMNTHRQPSFSDEFPEEDRESLDRNRPAISSFAEKAPARSAAARHINAAQ
jgi:hypothetical protein